MRRGVPARVFAACLGAIPIVGCAPTGPRECSGCSQAKFRNGWCEACGVGYVAGVRIESRLLYDTLDAHGHTISPDLIACPTCQAAIKSNGSCRACRIGWVDNQAYFSRLTYQLARGQVQDVATIKCDTCKANAQKRGWCDACQRGMIGNVAIRVRDDFEDGSRAFDLMLVAVQMTRRCDYCAMAVVANSDCPFCKISYKDGRKVASASGS